MADPTERARSELKERIEGRLVLGVPHNQALGLRVHDYGPNQLSLCLPYRDEFVGYPETGVLHGGVITALMDATCGGATILSLDVPRRVATLDLRIDYLRPGLVGQDVICAAHCYKVTRHVAFLRASAHHGDEADPIATATGTFVIFAAPSQAGEEATTP